MRPDAVCEVPPKPTFTIATPDDEEEIFKFASLPPVVCGLKTICTTQLAPAASVAPHDEAEIEKTPVGAPVIAALSPARDAPPVFVTVTL